MSIERTMERSQGVDPAALFLPPTEPIDITAIVRQQVQAGEPGDSTP